MRINNARNLTGDEMLSDDWVLPAVKPYTVLLTSHHIINLITLIDY